MKNQVERAKNIIQKILYVTISTVDAEAQPWNTPVYSAFNEEYNFFWASDQNGQHSKNITVNNKIFIVIYDSTAAEGKGEGVYIKAKAFLLEDESEIIIALKYLDDRVGKESHSPKEFMGEMPRRVYKAVPEKFWINDDGDLDGNYIDIRHEIELLRK